MKFTRNTALALTLMAQATFAQTPVFLQDVNGQKTSLDDLKGKWVLINYWAGWCQTCIEEIPELNRFYLNHKKDPVALYAVNYDSPPLFEQNNLIRKLNISYPSLTNDPARELNLGDIRGVPVTFVINPKGVLVKTLYGGQTSESLDQVISTN